MMLIRPRTLLGSVICALLINVDQIHFVPARKEHIFILPRTIRYFIVNTRQAVEEVQKMLEEMNLLLGEKWAYDPCHIISKKRMENGYAHFIHESRL